MYGVETIELRKKMLDKGFLTIGSLSDACGVNRNTLSDVLNGKTLPSAYVMSRLVKTLDLTPEEAGRIFFTKELTSNVS